MKKFHRKGLLCLVGLCGVAAMAQSQIATIERVTVTGSDDKIVVAIDASRPLTPHGQLLGGPDRIVVDLPGAVPGKEVRDIPLRGALHSVRVALFSMKPPVTRVVLDLKMPQKYRISAIGNKVLVTVDLAEQLPGQSNGVDPRRLKLEDLGTTE
jgi:AMIN domain